MIIKKYDETPLMENNLDLDARVMYDTENAVVVIMALRPGQVVKKHISPVDLAFYVLEGTGTIQIGEEIEDVEANSLIECPKGVPMGWSNRTKAPAKVMVIKAPRPTEPVVFVD
jgi:quercetin dioxygenase-like cupin family protein